MRISRKKFRAFFFEIYVSRPIPRYVLYPPKKVMNMSMGAYDKTRTYYATADLAVGRLGRIFRFTRQFLSLRTHAHSKDVVGGNNTTMETLLLLSHFTKFTFCLDYSDNRKPRN